MYVAAVGALLVRVLPLAIGAACSPTTLIANLLVLSLPEHHRARSLMFVLGNVVVLAAFTTIVFVGLIPTVRLGPPGSDPTEAVIDLAAAALLALLAVREIRHHPDPAKPKKTRRLPDGPLPEFFGFGVVMMVTNFSTLVIYFPAAKDISLSTVGLGGQVVATVLLFTITTTMVWVPTAFELVSPTTAMRMLGRLKDVVTSHQRLLTIGVLVLYAGYLAVRGVLKL